MNRKEFLKSLITIPAITIHPSMLYQNSDLNNIRKAVESRDYKLISKKFLNNNGIFFEIQNCLNQAKEIIN